MADAKRPSEPGHDPGDPGCVEHDPHKVYTRVLHWCRVCRTTENGPSTPEAEHG